MVSSIVPGGGAMPPIGGSGAAGAGAFAGELTSSSNAMAANPNIVPRTPLTPVP